MIEQQLAERFHAVVCDEPPLELDPDEFVDGLLRRRRRRQALATAFAVVAIATVAVAGVTSAGRGSGERAAAPPTASPPPATPPPTTASSAQVARFEVAVEVAAPVLSKGKFAIEPAEISRDDVHAVDGFVIDQSVANVGLLQIRQGDAVLYEVDLSSAPSMAYDFPRPVFVKPGQGLIVAVSCRKSWASDGVCHATITFSVPKVAR